jgi:hypothetical protein
MRTASTALLNRRSDALWRTYLDFFLWTVLAISGTLLGARAAFGPFKLGLSVSSPMNAETFFAMAAVLLLLLRAQTSNVSKTVQNPRHLGAWGALLILLAGGIAAWAWTLRFPFIADDYAHITHGLRATPSYLWGVFTIPAADRFFRPFGLLAYAAEARLFGTSRVAWHASSLVLHIANSALLFGIARKRAYRSWPAGAAALFFLLHGTRPEAVTWISAQFDLWATFFFLLALLAFLRRVESGAARWQIVSLSALFFALISKEAAYVFPLVLCLIVWLDGIRGKKAVRLLAPPFALTGLVFLYRWLLLGGIGGYRTGTGTPFIYSINLFRTAKALLLRPVAVLDFPMNWTRQPEWWLWVCLILGMVALAASASAKTHQRKLWFGLGFLLVAALPVHQFLLIDADLEKSRVLYLPSAGFALVFAAVLESLRPRIAVAVACATLALQTAALEHNLMIWSNVAQLAANTCTAAAKAVTSAPGPIAVSPIPNKVDGVYFLHTGFRECVEWAAGSELPGMVLDTEPQPAGLQPRTVLRWDQGRRALTGDSEK